LILFYCIYSALKKLRFFTQGTQEFTIGDKEFSGDLIRLNPEMTLEELKEFLGEYVEIGEKNN